MRPFTDYHNLSAGHPGGYNVETKWGGSGQCQSLVTGVNEIDF